MPDKAQDRKKADRKALLGLLNKSLELEYGLIMLYPAYAGMIRDVEVADSFRDFGRQSLAHADVVAALIKEMGAEPATVVPETKVEYGLDMEQLLLRQLALEEEAEGLYSKCLDIVGSGYVAEKLRGLLKAEVYHARYLTELLETWRSRAKD